ncbi:hypothetical protein VTN02DRAFT_2969 [Thermoascus thermophilus]
MSASAASTANATSDTPTSPTTPRSGPLRRLSQLRSYAQDHLTSHSSSNGGRSYRNSLSRVVSSFHSNSAPEASSLQASRDNRASRDQAPCPEGGGAAPSPDPSVPSTGSYSGSSSELQAQTSSSESARSTPSNDPETQASRSMTQQKAPSGANGQVSPTPDSGSDGNASTPSRPDGGSSESTPSNQAGGADTSGPANAEPGSGASKPKPRATIRFYAYQDPHQSSRPSLPFAPMTRTLPSEDSVIRVGRYSERDGIPVANPTEPSDAPIGFKSKVVSRKHCEFSFINGQWHIKDVGSSSGTFLNHMRLSQPNMVSRQYAVRDGDIVQLGIDFRGGEEMIFRCVRIRIECNRTWQQRPNEFNKNTESLIRNLGKGNNADYAGCRECSICLGSVLRPYQCLFMAACAHVWHYKCIRRLIHTPEYPMFQCPNCRAYTDLSAEVDDSNDFDDEQDKDAAPGNHEEAKPDANPPGPETNHTAEESSPPENGAHQAILADDADLAAITEHMRLEERRALADAQDAQSSNPGPEDSAGGVERSANIDIPNGQSSNPLSNALHGHQGQLRGDTSGHAETFEDNPMTPRNDSGPLAFDGRASRSAS